MSGSIRAEKIRDRASISDQKYLRGMIRLEKSGVKASGEKMRQIGADREYHRKREEPCQKRKEKCSENIRADIGKRGVEQSGEISVVQNNTE